METAEGTQHTWHLLCAKLCPLKDTEVLTPVPVTMILFGNQVFADDDIKMTSLGWTLIQDDQCPYKKGKSGHRDRHSQREDHVKTQGEDSHLQVKECLRAPEARREAWDGFSLTASEGARPPPEL